MTVDDHWDPLGHIDPLVFLAALYLLDILTLLGTPGFLLSELYEHMDVLDLQEPLDLLSAMGSWSSVSLSPISPPDHINPLSPPDLLKLLDTGFPGSSSPLGLLEPFALLGSPWPSGTSRPQDYVELSDLLDILHTFGPLDPLNLFSVRIT